MGCSHEGRETPSDTSDPLSDWRKLLVVLDGSAAGPANNPPPDSASEEASDGPPSTAAAAAVPAPAPAPAPDTPATAAAAASITAAARFLREAKEANSKLLVMTGAGMSVMSGVPVFRGSDGSMSGGCVWGGGQLPQALPP